MVWLLCRLAEGRLARFTGAACLAILCVMVSVPVVANRAMLFARNPAVIARLIYGYNPFDFSAAIADEVKRGTSPSDTVLVIGSEPQILFYADRRSATRYIYLSPLAVAPFGGLQAELDATLREVERSRPKMVVDVTRIPTSLLAGPRTNRQFFDSLYRTLGAQGVWPASFFMPVATRTVGAGGEAFRVVEPYAVLERERVQHKWVSGVMVLRRPEPS